MRRVALSLVLLLTFPSVAQPRRRAVVPPSFPAAQVDALVAVQMQKGIPGVAISIRSGRNVWSHGYGVMDTVTAAPATPDSLFQIASLTKQMTAAATMRLVERGQLHLDDPLDKYFAAFAGRGVTLAHLLTHTSGLPDYTAFIDPYSPVDADAVIAQIARRTLLFTPGSKYQYSNSNYFILGRIIELVSGQKYAQFLDRELFAPAGLLATGVCGSRADLPVPVGYELAAGTLVQSGPVDVSVSYAAGGVCSTATDLLRWNAALSSGAIVSKQSYDAMTKPVLLSTGATSNYGYGLVSGSDRGNRIIVHDGLIDGFQSYLAYYPDANVTIAVLVNGILSSSLPADDIGVAVGKLLLADK